MSYVEFASEYAKAAIQDDAHGTILVTIRPEAHT